MSQSFFKYETEQEKFERIKRLRVEMLKNQLREARRIMQKQYDALDAVPGQALDNRESSYSLAGELNSDELSTDGFGAGGDIDGNGQAAASEAFRAVTSDDGRRDRFDLSSYLAADREFQGEGEQRLKEILARVEERIPDSDKARGEYARLMQGVQRIIGDSSIDIEHKISMVEQRVIIYIENRNYDNSALDEDLLMDYKALCILLGIDEQVLSVEELRSRVDEMLEEYSRKSNNEVVAEMVNEALINLGMRVDGCCVLDGQMDGELYSSKEGGKCKVFVSCNDSGVMIEPVKADEGAKTDEIIASQRKVCAAERELMEEAEKSGILLKKVYSNEHSPEDMAGIKDLAFNGEYVGVGDLTEASVEQDAENKFERIRSYNRMRRERRRKEKAREMRYE